MAISYPIAIPNTNSIVQFNLDAVNAVAYSQSPFTFAGQSHAYAGQMWELSATLKPMRRSQAEPWISMLTSLRGQFGTFLIGDPLGCSLRGTATSATISGSAGDNSVAATLNGSLLAGDYIQLGTGSTATLHKVLVNLPASGTLEIWPALRSDQSSASATLSNTVGRFRLAENSVSRPSDSQGIYSISFSAMEAL